MREGSRESSCHRVGRWRRALRRHLALGIGDAYGQSRHRSERSRARSKRALRVQSVSMPVAAELRLPPGGYYGYGPSYYGPSYAPSYYGSGAGGYGYALGWPGGVPGGLHGGGLYGRWWW